MSGAFFVIIASVAFGSMPIFAHAAYRSGVDPTTLLFLRFSIAAVLMVAWMGLRRRPWPRGRPLWVLIGMGAVLYVTESLAYFTALTMASAGLVALLLYLYPTLVALLSVAIFKERFTAIKASALALAALGTVLTIGHGGGGRPLGIALGLCAALVYSVFIIAGSWVGRYVDPLTSTAVIFVSAALSYGGIVAARGVALPQSGSGWLAIFALGTVSTVLSIICFLTGVQKIGATNASTLATVEPAVTVVLSAMFLGETVDAGQMLGGVFILAAVVTLARHATREPRKASG